MPKKYQLKNGMKVLLYPNRRSPVVSVQVWVGTGSADEKTGEEGISHFIEHLLFKGSKNYGVGEMAKTIEAHGGQFNAYTTFDQTVFYCTLSSAFTFKGLHVLSDMMGSPTFDPMEIDREREVVIEEIKRSLDNPRQVAARALFGAAYGKHPYAVPIIGFEENIRAVTPEEIRNYYDTRYSPKNMTLLVVGDIDEKTIKKDIENTFGRMPVRRLGARKRSKFSACKGLRVHVQESTFSESHVFLSWPVPKTKHKDMVSLSLLSMILGQGESSRLVQSLRNRDQIVNTVGAFIFSAKDEGLFVISGSMAKEKIEAFIRGVGEELAKILTQGPTADELQRIKTQVESDRYYSMETVDGLASVVGHYDFFYGDHRVFDKHIRETAKTTTRAIWKIANKYLNVKKLDVVCLSNEKEEATADLLRKSVASWAKTYKKSTSPLRTKLTQKTHDIVIAPKKSSKSKAPVRIEIGQASRLVCKQVVGTTVVSTRLGWRGGSKLSGGARPGLNELFGRVWGTSTAQMNEKEINEYIESRAGSLSPFAGKNTIGLSATSLLPLAEAMGELAKSIISEPVFDKQIIQREYSLMKEYAKNRVDKPMQKCMAHLSQILFPDHVYGQDIYENLDRIADVTPGELAEHLKKHFKGPFVLSVVGDVNLKKWEKFANSLEGICGGAAETKDVVLPPLEKPAYRFEMSEKQQTHLAIAFRGLLFSDHRRPALDCLQAVLSGQGGRLFVELRDKASLAYSVSPIRMDGLDAGYFGAYIGCSPEKADTAVKMMRDEFQKLMDRHVDEDELQRAKRYLIGRHDISLQKTGFIADELFFDEIYGAEFGESENYKKHITAVTVEDIRELANAILSTHPALSVVGPKDVLI